MKDSVIIVSGGMDSITMLYEYKEDIALGISITKSEIARHGKALGIDYSEKD